MEHKRILELALEALQDRRSQVEAEVEALRGEMVEPRRQEKPDPPQAYQESEEPRHPQKEKPNPSE